MPCHLNMCVYFYVFSGFVLSFALFQCSFFLPVSLWSSAVCLSLLFQPVGPFPVSSVFQFISLTCVSPPHSTCTSSSCQFCLYSSLCAPCCHCQFFPCNPPEPAPESCVFPDLNFAFGWYIIFWHFTLCGFLDYKACHLFPILTASCVFLQLAPQNKPNNNTFTFYAGERLKLKRSTGK